MIYSNKIDLIEFINEINDCEYTIVKIGEEFPNYYPRNDIDIFCTDINKVAKKILKVGNKYLDQDFKIEISEKDFYHKQIDFLLEGQIDFRFDLFGAFPEYHNVTIKKSYFYSLIDKRKEKIITHKEIGHKIFVPDTIDEIIVRYLDYLEYFSKRKDKIKHLDYVRKKINESDVLESFLDRFYEHISMPLQKEKYYSYTKKKLAIIDILKKVKNKGLSGSIKKVLFG